MYNSFSDVANLIARNDKGEDVYSELQKLSQDDKCKLLNNDVTSEWLQYLRSGKYKQPEFYQNEPTCVLGVLCALTNPSSVKLSRLVRFKNFVKKVICHA